MAIYKLLSRRQRLHKDSKHKKKKNVINNHFSNWQTMAILKVIAQEKRIN